MLWANKKLVQSVTFTEDTADIALWEAIDKELSAAKYQTFSNLCKQALWQFLFVNEPTTAASQNSPQLQQQLIQLQEQMGELEKNVLTQEQNQFYRVEARLNRMAQQLAQLQATLNQQPSAAPSPPAPEQPATPIQPPQPEEQSPSQPEDPLLTRLGSLLDEF